ncbi:hypothetical protein ACU4GD_34965 [Cupriavidus basilensis]
MTSANSHLNSGKFGILAITGTQRFLTSWRPCRPSRRPASPGLSQAAGSRCSCRPARRATWSNRLSTEIGRIVRLPEVSQEAFGDGTAAGRGPLPEELAALVATDTPQVGPHRARLLLHPARRRDGRFMPPSTHMR